MRADGEWQCSELTGKPTYLRATATGTLSDYSDAYGIDNHVYDFAFIRLILKAFQLGRPRRVTDGGLHIHRIRYPVGRCVRVDHGPVAHQKDNGLDGRRSPRHLPVRAMTSRPCTVRKRSRRHPVRRPLSIEKPSSSGHHPGLHAGADVGE